MSECRKAQPRGHRGSLKWLQRAVAEHWPALEAPIAARLGGADARIEWVSPLESDDFAEYRDAAFLDRVGLSRLCDQLRHFWPSQGPQWDALAVTPDGRVVLVEAKAHIDEFCTRPTKAGPASRARIEASLRTVAEALGSPHGDRWPDQFYQLANRLAHLWFLRDAGIDAILALVGFLDDADISGPRHAETWEAAYRIADYTLGLPARHGLSRHILHVHPSVAAHV